MDLLIFDFDGVIADTEIIWNAVLADVINGLGHSITPEEVLMHFAGKRWSDCVEDIERRTRQKIPSNFANTCRELARQRFEEELTTVAGAEEFIEKLGATPRCIASSSELHTVRTQLQALGLTEFFGENVFSAVEHVTHGKPAPDLFLFAASRMNADPRRTVVIEDSVFGVQAGVAAGMTVIGLLAASHIRDGHAARLMNAGAHHLATSYAEVETVWNQIA